MGSLVSQYLSNLVSRDCFAIAGQQLGNSVTLFRGLRPRPYVKDI